ncbi:uncharacterized protein LOC112466384 [Temnothorax curvispinosus]|uniref:Uncharacterized protein LOC112466384 n=1 Tax=Temnothorax curvispinosus TaxID=300111 RepID=A0A6J1RBD1_9HYME|nr:uncharacterized protein LOC112466384 [Temnothorax curvispinosus]
MSKAEKREEIRQLIQALLLSRNGATAVPLLERDYYNAENTRIPYRLFGYSNLVEFLQSFPEHFIVEQYNGGHYVRGIPSERSRHVSSLVSRQRMRECIRNDQSSVSSGVVINRRVISGLVGAKRRWKEGSEHSEHSEQSDIRSEIRGYTVIARPATTGNGGIRGRAKLRHVKFVHFHGDTLPEISRMSKAEKREEIRQLILALLVSRKGATAIPVLERDYYYAENTRIPYRQFGYYNLVEFLQSFPEHFIVEQYNGVHYVRGIPSEKSKHVSSLVSRQRMREPPKARYIQPRFRPPFNRRPHHYARPVQEFHIAPDMLCQLLQHIKDNPNGVSLQDAVTIVQRSVPYVSISAQQLRGQLQLLSHQLRLDGNMIFPILSNDSHKAAQQQLPKEEPQLPSKSQIDSESPPTPTICAAGQEDYENGIEYFSDDDFLPADSASNCQRRAETNGEISDKEAFAMMNGNGNTEMRTADVDMSQLISDRIKLRLKELMRKHPDGIWCPDLPNLYLREYKVCLNYVQLGFDSVREFASYLPQIFYMTQVDKMDDFMLYSADKRPVVPEPIDIAQTLRNYEDNPPFPSDVSPTITRIFAPNDVMNYDDKVDKISVVELKRNRKYLGVYVIEVFHPNFFWVHLRENRRHFDKMMDDLSDFYEYKKSTYTIAKIALKKDLNCACIYANRWHRAIIRSVKPDFRVTVFFYDYGTMKTYTPEDVYYLHQQFAYLPAQAIPCGLYKIKPSVGDRWKRSVAEKFSEKIEDTLLAATIVTIDPEHNSMMVILTDTSEEEDVRINDWLVNERLAQVGNTVRMFDIIHYMTSDKIKSSKSIKTFNAGSADNINKSRHRNNLISRDERAHRLSDVKSEDIENNTVKSLHNVPNSKKVFLQRVCSKSLDAKSLHDKSSSAKSLNAKSPDTEALDTRSQSRNYPQTGQSRTPTKVPLLEKSKTLSHNRKSDSEPSTSMSGTNTEEDNARQIDSSREVKLQNNGEIYNSPGYMDFSMRDSDDENNDTKDFGTFRSLYGGHGLMEPFDWSVIREENKTTDTVPDNLDMSSKKHKSDVEDKSGSHNQRNETPGEQYFLNMTRMEEEIFLPEDNISLPEDNISQRFDDMTDFIKMMRDKTTPNQIVTVRFKPMTMKTLYDSVESEDTSKSSTNIVEFNDVTSSREINREVDRNGKVCERKANLKIQDGNSNTDPESVFSNISNKDNMSKEMSGRNTNNSLASSTNNKACIPGYKRLLDKLSRKTNSNFVDSSESSSSEQIRSSSYSINTSNDSIIISSNDEQSKASNCMDINNRIKIHSLVKKSMSEELPKKLTLDESHNDSTVTTFSSIETDSLASSNVDDIKQRQLNQSLEIDSRASNVDDTKQHQLNRSDSIPVSCNIDDSKYQLHATDQTALDVPKLMQQMLKIVKNIQNNNTELDSDDLTSSRESINDDKSDESKRGNESIKSDFVSETCKSMNDDANVTEIAFAPVVNDCDVESDDGWDVCAGSIEDSISFLHRAHNISNAINLNLEQ